MGYQYDRDEILDMLRLCKKEKGMCTPRNFNSLDETCSASTVMNRFGTWTAAKEEAGISEDASSETGVEQEYEDEDVLNHIRICADRNGKATVRNLQSEKDLVSPSVAVERFGSWSEAKREAGLGDDRLSNSRPRKYTDEQYLELLRACEEQHGKVTQRLFNNLSNDEKDIELDIEDIDGVESVPTSGSIRQRFADKKGQNGWSRAKRRAGVNNTQKRYTDEELLEQLRTCKEKYGTCTASQFASKKEFASPETLQRRFETWSEAKKKAGIC